MKTRQLAPGVTIRLPEDYELATAQPGGRGGEWEFPASGFIPLPAEPGTLEPLGMDTSGWIVPALQAGELDLLHEVTLEHSGQLPGGRALRGPGEDEISFSLEMTGEEVPVVLFEQDGMYLWRYSRASANNYVFSVTVGESPAPAREGDRGLILDKIKEFAIGKIKAYVLKFLATRTVEAAGHLLERNVSRGVVLINEPSPLTWKMVKTLPAFAGGQRRRILLFVHGTFSSTAGAFGDLGFTPWGQDFLASAQKQYDAIIGFDHATLTEDPLENAGQLLIGLKNLFTGSEPPEFDVIAHSRGGLVIRCLIEKLLPSQGWKPDFRRVVFVACTNEGTLLAKPANWEHLINLYTNLITGNCRAVSLIAPQAAPFTVIFGEVIKNIGSFVKYCADAAFTHDLLPGLAAMVPDGEFVKDINLFQPGQPSAADSHNYVITSNFSPTLGGNHEPKELPKRLLELLAAGLAGQVMQAEGDLVVNLSSMDAIDKASGNYVKGKFDFGRNPQVYHTNYFIQPKVAGMLQEWLEPDVTEKTRTRSADVATDIAGVNTATAMDVTTLAQLAVTMRTRKQRWYTARGIGVEWDIEPDGAFPKMIGASLRRIDLEIPLSDVELGPPEKRTDPKVLCYFKASMDEEVIVMHATTLVVEVSREALEAAVGNAEAMGKGEVTPDEKILLRVVPQTKFTITDANDGREEIDLPKPGEPHHFYVDLKATEEGVGEIWVLVRQGAVNVLKLTLKPRVVQTKKPSSAKVRAESEAMRPRPAERPINQLCIEEVETGTGFYYRFDIYFAQPLFRKLGVKVFGPEGVKKVDYVDGIYKAIEGLWSGSDKDKQNFDQKLRAYGADLFRQLFPPELRTVLWQGRNERTHIQVISSEPFIPWEFMHLCDPAEDSGMPEETLYLSQFGVIRWLDGVSKSGWPPEELRLRGENRIRHVIPDYHLLPVNRRLPEAQQEGQLLQTKYGALAVTPDSNEVREIISRSGQFDILHFACHGQAESTAIGEARLLMEGRVEGNNYLVDTIGEKEVAQFARLSARDGGPLIFLNACQAGRLGYKLTGIGGFAKAFLRGGSGVFVGALWSVGDKAAFEFCKRFYEALLDEGSTLAEAVIAAREAARATGDATWLAYVVYGHPNFRVVKR